MSDQPLDQPILDAPFVHLHVHSHYSLLDGMNKIPNLVKTAKEFGMPALALTDHGNMHGAIEFYKTCKKHGVKPIIGMEAYVAKRSRFDKEPGIDNRRYHLTLLAKNNTGYRNLMKMSSLSFLEGYYYKPRIDKDLLRQYNEGIICLSGCPASEFVQLIKNGQPAEARKLIEFYIELFGREHVFIEIMRHDEVEWYADLKPDIMAIATEMDLPLVATWDSHYTCVDDREAHDTLLAINTNNKNFKLTGDYSFIGPDRALEEYREYGNAVINTRQVADLVDIEIELGTWVFPAFPLPPGKNADQELRDQVYAKIPWRYGETEREDVIERIEHELDVIAFKGFSIYMLIVGDLVRFAQESGILTNIRGSVAGSIVTYLLGITNVDPLYYQLPFTRFLNKERPTAPDIDMDFADNRRDEVINYAREKYGRDAVAQIGTFGTMMARGAVRDVARALEYSYETGDKIAKLIPMGSQGFPMTISHALEIEPDLKTLYDQDADVQKIIELAKKIEGCARHVSVHAAGVVISPTRVDDYSPIQVDQKSGKIITQYDMHAVEDAGLIKFDFLGIRNLAILADAIERVAKIRGITVDVEEIPIDDKRTYEMLARGETMGVFQLSGGGMTKWLKELRPTDIHDINAMVALYRPGPMEVIPEYIKRKYNPAAVRYMDPRMKDYLERSYGLLVYQDDVMLTAINLAGYTWLEADKLRKAMGKKIPELMEEQKKKLMAGLLERGMDQKMADTLWELIEPFAAYGFNKAHAASYGQLAYRTAYMKANYPHEYLTAIMTAESGNTDKVAEVMEECRRMDFEIMPPDVNESFSDYTVVVEDELPEGKTESDIGTGDMKNWIKLSSGKYITDRIRFGLRNIKNFGEEIGKVIIAERKNGGKFTSIENFLERVQHRNLNKKSLEALVMTGAMDAFGERARLIHNMEQLLRFNKEFRDQNSAQDSLFGGLGDTAPTASLRLLEVDPASQKQKLYWEKELLGLYISGHPLEEYKERLKKHETTTKKILESNSQGRNIVLAGIISDAREIMTKKGDKMAFIKLSDLEGVIECVVFPKLYNENRELYLADSMLVVQGRVNERNGEKSIIVEKAKMLQ